MSDEKTKPAFKLWDKTQPFYLRLWGLLIILISVSMMLPD